jgi:hypothetical protein
MNRALKCQEIVVLTPCASKYYPEAASALCAVQFFMHPRPGSCNSETMTLLLFVPARVCVCVCVCYTVSALCMLTVNVKQMKNAEMI